ncbi:hypothetical protein [Nocardia jiangxiensis]|uniref:CopG family transcriptional regulator n=1 Tax=Nocardia jiangxiensis TaxID=282685 RepID=A0ABW6S3A2_9NOCA|nr:hypothetical protein [Nocardia jiangxiensis]
MIRLTEQNESRLRDYARIEGQSMNAIVNAAVSEYIERHERRAEVSNVIADQTTKWAELLERLK